jgi:DNA-binding transcriptional ArsR family regulator
MTSQPVEPSDLSAAPDAAVLLSPTEVLAAASDPARYQILQLLADGAALSVNQLASRIGRSNDLTSKHLKVLRAARIIMPVEPPGSDGRRQYHQIPSIFLKTDAGGRRVLDFGPLAIRV